MRIKLALMAALFAASSGAAWAQAGGPERLRRMDFDGDGAVTRAEASAARTAIFNRLDSNGDSTLSAEERAAAASRRGAAQLMSSSDADGDGRLTRAEFMAAPYRVFDRLDANEDGVISAEEMATAGAGAQ
jgi:Ca2+-binding EF-hand superfamily protein